ncbi:MAG: single-stranded-DNA-specific exonuclease RecJ [Chitinophagales bacterium]|nr:single-stranded-DNA-specific exonuclease RecJ [Chitinophagales bacterium]
MLQKRWTIKHADAAKAALLQEALKIHPAFCRMLVMRGVETFEQARAFFRPELNHLHDPFLMKDMDKAVDRIHKAVTANERILIYGDYDVDGTTSVSLMVLFFQDFYPNIDFYIPNRYKEGYGISTQGIDYAEANGCSLIIALDCGIKSIDKVDYALAKKIDFIICDHHLPGEELPKASAVLDPKRSDCAYPFKELSGCGVGFKLIQALALHYNLPEEKYLDVIDLVAVSTASDIVSLSGENRVLTYFGIEKLNKNPSHGLKHLIRLTGLERKLDVSDVVFYIGPRINAAGRMDDAKQAVRLMIADESPHHADQAGELQNLNKDRQEADRDITAHALEILNANADNESLKSTVVFNTGWHKGVIGIVASRLTEHFYRPTVVLTEHEGKVTGSARSVKGFDLYEALYACREQLIQFGGHKFAAGLTMLPEKVNDFRNHFERVVSASITPEQLIPEIEIDAEINFSDITPLFYKLINEFAPFGPDNMKPVFVAKHVKETGWSKLLKDRHIKFSLKQNGVTLSGIGFDMAHKMELLKENEIDVVFQIEENEWQGNKSFQLMVKDIRVSEA